MINKIANWIKNFITGKGEVRYKIVNDITQEWFEVSGPNIRGCRIIADQECARLGWKVENMRSEEL